MNINIISSFNVKAQLISLLFYSLNLQCVSNKIKSAEGDGLLRLQGHI